VARNTPRENPTDPPDRAGRAYWDRVWTENRNVELPDPSTLTYVERSFSALFDSALGDLPRGARVIEIGAAHSIWLAHFARRGLRVTGIDYSEIGCVQTKAALRAEGLDAELLCCDAFSPPQSLIGGFDVVLTVGVVEHFDDTAATVAAFARFLRPGGRMVTVVPNVGGANGLVQRVVNPRVLQMHVPLTAAALASAQVAAGLSDASARYFIASNFGVLNLNDLDPRAISTRTKRSVVRMLERASRLTWALDRIVSLPVTSFFSGYVVGFGSRPTT
jgi:2-polyprenyl-3-methyl-5-hydroxy-6-metoxy-1,4-benzoquinol methylase